MPSLFQETVFLKNLYATPADWQRDLFYSVVRAGHLRAGIDHRIERETYPGHEIILCLSGRGWLRIAGKKHDVSAGQLVWVNCHHPHAYGAVSRDPWELYWLRIEGRPLDRISELLQIRSQPVFDKLNARAAAIEFERAFDTMTGTRPSDAALASAAVAAIIGITFDARLSEPGLIQPELPAAVQRALERMRLYFHLPMRVAELAQLSGMSESHFSRQFKAAMGTSPIDWLRRERINQAKRRLIESNDPVKEIARQVGYHDQFFFSKDFKKMTKLTPTQFREQESHA
ncbi:MAG: AraC family transcriptional regulator [Verrucomicrobiaceae bacterium]|nr:AraC family transcriptional regulator [Verrucomicrobiaceae bacterium]